MESDAEDVVSNASFESEGRMQEDTTLYPEVYVEQVGDGPKRRKIEANP